MTRLTQRLLVRMMTTMMTKKTVLVRTRMNQIPILKLSKVKVRRIREVADSMTQ